jgi:hypothetical protein
LCPHIYTAQDLWHSHTGAYSRKDEKIKRLINIDVDFLEEAHISGLRRVVVVTTILTDMLNQPGYEAQDTHSKPAEIIGNRMLDLHNFGKIAFGQVINDEMSTYIALNP